MGLLISCPSMLFVGQIIFWRLFMNKFFAVSVLVCFIFASCTTTTPRRARDVNYTYPHSGSSSNAPIAIKDYQSLGIIFVRSSETVDGYGNHTGSKITYEMLMLEAQKLNADDIINIRIDVNHNQEIYTGYNSEVVTKTTYNYTATALAIKYTTAITLGSADESQDDSQDLASTMPAIPIVRNIESQSGGAGKTVAIVSGVLAGLILIGMGVDIASQL
jgi:hypothetical protein